MPVTSTISRDRCGGRRCRPFILRHSGSTERIDQRELALRASARAAGRPGRWTTARRCGRAAWASCGDSEASGTGKNGPNRQAARVFVGHAVKPPPAAFSRGDRPPERSTRGPAVGGEQLVARHGCRRAGGRRVAAPGRAGRRSTGADERARQGWRSAWGRTRGRGATGARCRWGRVERDARRRGTRRRAPGATHAVRGFAAPWGGAPESRGRRGEQEASRDARNDQATGAPACYASRAIGRPACTVRAAAARAPWRALSDRRERLLEGVRVLEDSC